MTADSSFQGPVVPDVPDVPVVPVIPVVPPIDLNAFKYLSFEDQFRGSPEEIARRLAGYVELFAGQSDVLDVGCGRGEFLELLRTGGISARGIELNQAMVEASRARGLSVESGDALAYLTSLADESIGGLFAAESMYHARTGASKAAFVALVGLLGEAGDADARVLDVQWLTPHLASIGAVEIDRAEYRRRLTRAVSLRSPFT